MVADALVHVDPVFDIQAIRSRKGSQVPWLQQKHCSLWLLHRRRFVGHRGAVKAATVSKFRAWLTERARTVG